MSPERFKHDRRSGVERRSGAERRMEEDRRGGLGKVIDFVVEADRRRRADRRTRRDRRARKDRRQPPVDQFSWKDTVRIHKMLADPNEETACPRCRASLLLGPLEFTEGVTTREVHCTGCRYSVAILEDG
jgi:hypothetical protein